MPTSLGPAEILVILVVALIVLGPKRLPEAGRQVGRAIAEVRKWSQSFQDEVRNAVDFTPGPPTYPTPPPGTEPNPIPMVPAETGPPGRDPTPPPAATTSNGSNASNGSNGSGSNASNGSDGSNGSVTTGSSGLVSGPPPPDPEPPAGEAPRT